jgi:NADPH:quinone reductase-like Zn-dependent oxidoreductase
VKRDEAVLVHGAAGRVGTAVLELGRVAGLRLYGTCSARDRAAVERLGAVAIDYRNEDFVARVRALPGKGVDVVLDGLGGALSLRSFRALRPGGRLVVYGHSATVAHGRRSWRGWTVWYATTALVGDIHPVVAERLPLTEARRAHEMLEGSASKGKLVLVP